MSRAELTNWSPLCHNANSQYNQPSLEEELSLAKLFLTNMTDYLQPAVLSKSVHKSLPTSKIFQFNTVGPEKGMGVKGRGAGSIIVHFDIK